MPWYQPGELEYENLCYILFHDQFKHINQQFHNKTCHGVVLPFHYIEFTCSYTGVAHNWWEEHIIGEGEGMINDCKVKVANDTVSGDQHKHVIIRSQYRVVEDQTCGNALTQARLVDMYGSWPKKNDWWGEVVWGGGITEGARPFITIPTWCLTNFDHQSPYWRIIPCLKFTFCVCSMNTSNMNMNQ